MGKPDSTGYRQAGQTADCLALGLACNGRIVFGPTRKKYELAELRAQITKTSSRGAAGTGAELKSIQREIRPGALDALSRVKLRDTRLRWLFPRGMT